MVVDSGLLGIAVLRKWAHRTQQLKGIRFHGSKLWRIKKPNEHGLVWRVDQGWGDGRRCSYGTDSGDGGN